jgi:NAD(P)-dependent dehydrogenase (short-subunit alcohol dehydrogenase family)
VPIKRMIRPAEVAAVAVFLASDDASYVNGQSWAVDGGYTMI